MNWVYISDEVAADTDYFVTAARPNTDATMAQTSLAAGHNGGGRNVTVTTNGSESGISMTATGTDVDGAAQTETMHYQDLQQQLPEQKFLKPLLQLVLLLNQQLT